MVLPIYFGLDIGLMMLWTGLLITFGLPGVVFPLVNGLIMLFTGFFLTPVVLPKKSLVFVACVRYVLVLGVLVVVVLVVVVVVVVVVVLNVV